MICHRNAEYHELQIAYRKCNFRYQQPDYDFGMRVSQKRTPAAWYKEVIERSIGNFPTISTVTPNGQPDTAWLCFLQGKTDETYEISLAGWVRKMFDPILDSEPPSIPTKTIYTVPPRRPPIPFAIRKEFDSCQNILSKIWALFEDKTPLPPFLTFKEILPTSETFHSDLTTHLTSRGFFEIVQKWKDDLPTIVDPRNRDVMQQRIEQAEAIFEELEAFLAETSRWRYVWVEWENGYTAYLKQQERILQMKKDQLQLHNDALALKKYRSIQRSDLKSALITCLTRYFLWEDDNRPEASYYKRFRVEVEEKEKKPLLPPLVVFGPTVIETTGSIPMELTGKSTVSDRTQKPINTLLTKSGLKERRDLGEVLKQAKDKQLGNIRIAIEKATIKKTHPIGCQRWTEVDQARLEWLCRAEESLIEGVTFNENPPVLEDDEEDAVMDPELIQELAEGKRKLVEGVTKARKAGMDAISAYQKAAREFTALKEQDQSIGINRIKERKERLDVEAKEDKIKAERQKTKLDHNAKKLQEQLLETRLTLTETQEVTMKKKNEEADKEAIRKDEMHQASLKRAKALAEAAEKNLTDSTLEATSKKEKKNDEIRRDTEKIKEQVDQFEKQLELLEGRIVPFDTFRDSVTRYMERKRLDLVTSAGKPYATIQDDLTNKLTKTQDAVLGLDIQPILSTMTDYFAKPAYSQNDFTRDGASKFRKTYEKAHRFYQSFNRATREMKSALETYEKKLINDKEALGLLDITSDLAADKKIIEGIQKELKQKLDNLTGFKNQLEKYRTSAWENVSNGSITLTEVNRTDEQVQTVYLKTKEAQNKFLQEYYGPYTLLMQLIEKAKTNSTITDDILWTLYPLLGFTPAFLETHRVEINAINLDTKEEISPELEYFRKLRAFMLENISRRLNADFGGWEAKKREIQSIIDDYQTKLEQEKAKPLANPETWKVLFTYSTLAFQFATQAADFFANVQGKKYVIQNRGQGIKEDTEWFQTLFDIHAELIVLLFYGNRLLEMETLVRKQWRAIFFTLPPSVSIQDKTILIDNEWTSPTRAVIGNLKGYMVEIIDQYCNYLRMTTAEADVELINQASDTLKGTDIPKDKTGLEGYLNEGIITQARRKLYLSVHREDDITAEIEGQIFKPKYVMDDPVITFLSPMQTDSKFVAPESLVEVVNNADTKGLYEQVEEIWRQKGAKGEFEINHTTVEFFLREYESLYAQSTNNTGRMVGLHNDTNFLAMVIVLRDIPFNVEDDDTYIQTLVEGREAINKIREISEQRNRDNARYLSNMFEYMYVYQSFDHLLVKVNEKQSLTMPQLLDRLNSNYRQLFPKGEMPMVLSLSYYLIMTTIVAPQLVDGTIGNDLDDL
jgi:hypothetical protein